MATATMTSKGQVTIPLRVRTALRLEAGTRIEFVEIGKDQFAIVPATKHVQILKGMIRKPKRPVTIDEMNAAIAFGAAGLRRTR